MKLVLAQTKPYLGAVEKNLQKMVEVIKEAKRDGGEVILFPELSLTGYLLEEMVYDVAIREVPKELLELSKDISIIFGAVELGEDYHTYNTAYYLEDGEIKGKHRKVYLPTYGMFYEGRYFKSGNTIGAFNTKFGRVGMLVCEDAWHQSSSYILGEDGANYIFILTCSPTRGVGRDLEIGDTWYSLLKSSAICNTAYVAMCNRVGVEDGVNFWGGSAVFSPRGSKIAKMEFFQEGLEIIDLKEEEIRRARFISPIKKDEKIDLVLKELNRIKNSNI
ncbi:nitrilase-related carbon-nitrogen hydrolase [Cetobacterium ceti]